MSAAIEDLRHEHQAILSALQILAKMAIGFSGDAQNVQEDRRGFIGFLKEFADKCHHGKEEGFLFPAVTASGIPEAGRLIEELLAEHVRGRRLVAEMETAASGAADSAGFAGAAAAYTALLKGHIGKENDRLFPTAEKGLSKAELDRLYEAFEEHEEKVIGRGRHEQLHEMLEGLKRKYAA